jgi:hypothetical protein
LARVRDEVDLDDVRAVLDDVDADNDVLRGAIHALAALDPDGAAPTITSIGRRTASVPGGSAVAPSPKVAGACIVALGALPAGEAVTGLIELRHEVRHHGLRLDVDAALRAAAEARSTTVADLLDDYTPEHLLAAHLESLLATSRRWPIETWAARWGVSPVAEALVWSSADGEVWLWHPVDGDGPDDHVGEQPFEQVSRAVYRVGPEDGERFTERFAGRSLDHRRLMMLCKQRGWVTHAAGHWDPEAGGSAQLDLDDGRWRATFFVDVLGDGHPSLTAEHCVSDQVHVCRYDPDANAWELARLREVPPRVFSEAMRDVEHFVTAAAVDEPNEWQSTSDVRLRPSWPSSSWRPGSRLDVDGVTVRRAPASADRYPRG